MQKKNFYKNIFWKKTFLYLIIVLILPSCGYQKFSKNQVMKKIYDPIFISMPKNPLVFDNISSIFYKTLFLAYKKLGYNLSDSILGSFVLKTKIKSLDPVEKFVSPDLLLYNERIGLIVHCKILDVNKKLIAEKSFEYSRLISYPKDPIQNSKFLDFEYKKLMDRIAIRIERYFRAYLISNSVER